MPKFHPSPIVLPAIIWISGIIAGKFLHAPPIYFIVATLIFIIFSLLKRFRFYFLILAIFLAGNPAHIINHDLPNKSYKLNCTKLSATYATNKRKDNIWGEEGKRLISFYFGNRWDCWCKSGWKDQFQYKTNWLEIRWCCIDGSFHQKNSQKLKSIQFWLPGIPGFKEYFRFGLCKNNNQGDRFKENILENNNY